MALSELQERFCQFYVGECRGNGTEAAVRAGYTENRASAAAIASENLRKPNITGRIKDLRREALENAGYDKDHVREAIVRRLVGIITTNFTDIVHISPDAEDPDRDEVLRQIAEAHGGQQVLDFGSLIFVPTAGLTEEERGAIKRLKAVPATKDSEGGLEVEMNDPIAAAKLLAEIIGLKESDTTVNVNVTASGIASEVEARRHGAAEGTEDGRTAD